MNGNPSPPSERSQAAVKVDNVLRRALKISDPYDAQQVAEALLARYGDEAEAIRRETEGLPVVRTLPPLSRAETAGPARAEIKQARDDLDRDLDALIHSSQLKDINAELRGWRSAIADTAAEGLDAAPLALDPTMRSRAFAARRLLGDYARLSRYVGALTPNLSPLYRRLAQSCDVIAGLVLVLMGDALAAGGLTRGAFLLQAPASELRERRDAAVNALRNLVASTQEAFGVGDWPRGLEAYRQILQRLDAAGHSDLRALFNEANLARVFDELIDLAASSNADSLRALGATALMSVQRLHRLVRFGYRLTDPASPALATFLSAVSLFVQAFGNSRSGYRLLFIARPPIIVYGLYGIGGPDDGTDRLVEITVKRGELAEQLDCYLGCDCGIHAVRCQILLDKLLYDVDRAIDLYALGTDASGHGEPEQRAAAFGWLIHTFLEGYGPENGRRPSCIPKISRVIRGKEAYSKSQVQRILEDLQCALQTPAPPPLNGTASDDALKELMHDELCLQYDGELRFEDLVSTMAPSCLQRAAFDWQEVIEGDQNSDLPSDPVERTQNGLVSQEATSAVRNLISATLTAIGSDAQCLLVETIIPPHFETSLSGLVNNDSPDGANPSQDPPETGPFEVS